MGSATIQPAFSAYSRWRAAKVLGDQRGKAAAAAVFYEQYVAARQHPTYVRLRKQHREKFER